MSNENRRQTTIVVAFLIIALVAVSPLVFAHRSVDDRQAGHSLLGIASSPSVHNVVTEQHDSAGNDPKIIVDHTCVFTCQRSFDEPDHAHAPAP